MFPNIKHILYELLLSTPFWEFPLSGKAELNIIERSDALSTPFWEFPDIYNHVQHLIVLGLSLSTPFWEFHFTFFISKRLVHVY